MEESLKSQSQSESTSSASVGKQEPTVVQEVNNLPQKTSSLLSPSISIECPKCGKHTIVEQPTGTYRCIACDFKRDFSRDDYRSNKKGRGRSRNAKPTVSALDRLGRKTSEVIRYPGTIFRGVFGRGEQAKEEENQISEYLSTLQDLDEADPQIVPQRSDTEQSLLLDKLIEDISEASSEILESQEQLNKLNLESKSLLALLDKELEELCGPNS